MIYPQFATHNAQSLATIYEMGKDKEFEFQCLHGMGETLYDQVVGDNNLGRRVRIYAPVGTHKTLLAYLVRRLLENGANSSLLIALLMSKSVLMNWLNRPLILSKPMASLKIHSRHHLAIFMVIEKLAWIGFNQ